MCWVPAALLALVGGGAAWGELADKRYSSVFRQGKSEDDTWKIFVEECNFTNMSMIKTNCSNTAGNIWARMKMVQSQDWSDFQRNCSSGRLSSLKEDACRSWECRWRLTRSRNLQQAYWKGRLTRKQNPCVIGSHMDTVMRGGVYDGMLGVTRCPGSLQCPLKG